MLQAALELLHECGLLACGEPPGVRHRLQLCGDHLGLFLEILDAHTVEKRLLLRCQLLELRHLRLNLLQFGDPGLQQIEKPLLLPVRRQLHVYQFLEVLGIASHQDIFWRLRFLLLLLAALLEATLRGGARDVREDMHELQVLAGVMLVFELPSRGRLASRCVVLAIADRRQRAHEYLGKIVAVLLPHELSAPDDERQPYHLRERKRL
mmetsp:Transcript_110425/g.319150  ORF Transcript_110425/g.319150 Transcript_110425/m.319150 type:complete len:208 (+) Transcript_110425:553-1176(+)